MIEVSATPHTGPRTLSLTLTQRLLQRWGGQALLLLLVIIYCWRFVFGGEVFIPSQMVFYLAFFTEETPTAIPDPETAMYSDPVLKFYPWQTYTRSALQNGEFPFWNPYVFSGTPHFANGESAVLYPVSVLGYLLPHHAALNLSVVLRLFVAGLGMYLFVRTLSVSRAGAIIAAIAFMFSASMTVWLNYPVGYAYAWMPMMFYFGERIIRQRHLLGSMALALVIATQLLGGHVQASFMMLLTLGLYSLFRLIETYLVDQDRGVLLRRILLLGAAAMLGFALVAVQLLPFANWLSHTGEAEARSQLYTESPDLLSTAVVTFSTLAAAVVPNLFGNPAWGSSDYFPYRYIEQSIYTGIIPLVLALSAVWLSRHTLDKQRRRLVLFMAATGGIFLLLALRFPVINLINQLPLFNIVSPDRYRLIFTFCVAVLAGLGTDFLIQTARDHTFLTRLMKLILGLAAAGMALFIVLYGAIIIFPEFVSRFNRLAEAYDTLKQVFQPFSLELYTPLIVIGIFGIALFFYRRSKISASGFMTLMIGLIAVDLYLFTMPLYQGLPAEHVYPEVEPVHTLRQALPEPYSGRVLSLYDNLPGNINMVYDLPEVAGTDFPAKRYADFITFFGGELAHDRNRIRFADYTPQLDLLNVTHVIDHTWVNTQALQYASFTSIFRNDSVTIYENHNALPRAFVVHQVRVIEDDTQILETLADDSFDPTREVILEQSVPFELSDQTDASDTVRFTSYQGNSRTLETQTGHDGILFLSETYYPGWQATVDGQDVPIYRANYAFSAIYLPAGTHSVALNYTPDGFNTGLLISLVALVLIGTGIAGGLIMRSKRQR